MTNARTASGTANGERFNMTPPIVGNQSARLDVNPKGHRIGGAFRSLLFIKDDSSTDRFRGRSLADAERREDAAEHVVRRDDADDAADGVERLAQLERDELGGFVVHVRRGTGQ